MESNLVVDTSDSNVTVPPLKFVFGGKTVIVVDKSNMHFPDAAKVETRWMPIVDQHGRIMGGEVTFSVIYRR